MTVPDNVNPSGTAPGPPEVIDMTSADHGHVTYIRAFTPQTIEQKLNEAVAAAQDHARRKGQQG